MANTIVRKLKVNKPRLYIIPLRQKLKTTHVIACIKFARTQSGTPFSGRFSHVSSSRCSGLSMLRMSSLDDSFTENTFGELSYKFLEPVPNYLTCIICFGLLKEPVATECCGKMFCYEHSPRTERICPACRHTPLAVTRNKGIDSIVKDLRVFCLHHGESCEWSGHLCFEPEHRKSTCEFEVVSCR